MICITIIIAFPTQNYYSYHEVNLLHTLLIITHTVDHYNNIIIGCTVAIK